MYINDLKWQFHQDLVLLINLMKALVLIGNPLIVARPFSNAPYYSRKLFKTSLSTDRWERSGLKLESVKPAFSSLIVLLGGKPLKNHELYGLITSQSEVYVIFVVRRLFC